MFPTLSRNLLLLLLFFGNRPTRADQPGVPVGKDYLVQIQVISRHTDRAAQNDPFITAAANDAFFRGGGELSTEGIQHAKAIGAAYRAAYVTRAKFLDGRFDPKQAQFRSSGVDRVLMTASSFSSGLFRDNGVPVMAPVYTVPYAEDSLLAIDYSCKEGWDDVRDEYDLPKSSTMPNDLLQAMREREWQCAEPPSFQSDTLLSEYANSRTKPQLNRRQKICADDAAKKFMYNYISKLSGTGSNDTRALPRIQRSIGQLAELTVNTFKEMKSCYDFHATNASCDPNASIAQFRFTHDVNVISFMDVFSLQEGSRTMFKGNTPQFGASLVVELWVREGEFYTKMFLLNGADATFNEFRFCDHLTRGGPFTRVDRYCSLQAMEAAMRIYITGDPAVC